MDFNKNLVAKISDKNFRKEFINDANACVEKHFGETVNANIVVKKNTKDMYYMAIPHISPELSLNQLGNIQAAGSGQRLTDEEVLASLHAFIARHYPGSYK